MAGHELWHPRPSGTLGRMPINRAACVSAVFLLTTLSATAADIKAPIRGLVSMGPMKFAPQNSEPANTLDPLNARPGIFGGIVVLATWRQLQPSANAEIAADNTIDRALEEVRAYNRRNPQRPLGVKLRVWSGVMAPDWAKQIGGEPIRVSHNDNQRTLGRFWTPAYRHAWARFQEMLAARYDSEPLIREVAVTSCMSFTAEPFYLPDEPSVAGPLDSAGFKPFQFKQCLKDIVKDYAPWKTTNIEVPLNPVYMPLGNKKGDPAFTEEFMRSCRQEFGKRCIFDNHDFDTKPPGTMLPIYASMMKLGPPFEFQSFHVAPPDWDGTIRKAASMGAGSIELWQDYKGFQTQPDAKLKQWAAIMEASGK